MEIKKRRRPKSVDNRAGTRFPDWVAIPISGLFLVLIVLFVYFTTR